MAIKTEQDLSSNARTLWLKAHSAVELHNYPFAISLLQDVLKEEPAFPNGRRILRRSAIANTKGKMGAMMPGVGSKAASLVKKDPQAALVEAEKALATKPYDMGANLALKEAALALDFVEIAQLALETLVQGNPKDPKLMHQLGEFFAEHGHPEKAAEVFTKIAEMFPGDLTAIKRAKDSTANATLSREWRGEDYRQNLKDPEESRRLEEGNKAKLSDEQFQRLFQETYAQFLADSENLSLVNKLCALCERQEDWATALEWCNHAVVLTNGADAGLKRKADDLQLHVLDQRLREYKDALEDPGLAEDTRAEYQTAYENLVTERATCRLEAARERVNALPLELSLRLELGELLFEAGNVSEAISHLQKARTSPSAKVHALQLLGRCYEAKGMYDLAIMELETARDSLPTMDTTRKEVVYALALIFEKLGRKDEYLATLKQIYVVDCGFHDVAERVERSYVG